MWTNYCFATLETVTTANSVTFNWVLKCFLFLNNVALNVKNLHGFWTAGALSVVGYKILSCIDKNHIPKCPLACLNNPSSGVGYENISLEFERNWVSNIKAVNFIKFSTSKKLHWHGCCINSTTVSYREMWIAYVRNWKSFSMRRKKLNLILHSAKMRSLMRWYISQVCLDYTGLQK